MKSVKYIGITLLCVIVITSCYKGIDPISHVEPGEVMEAPVVAISYPDEGTQIRVKEDVTTLNIDFEVTDDIELQTITLSLDGNTIKSFSDFKDYRRLVREYVYDNLTNGTHTLMISATDLSGKNNSRSVVFEKIEPYQTQYDGENFYMPFDGDYLELVNILNATKVGPPGFPTDAMEGKSYAGAASAYLTYPTSELQLGNEFSAAFWYKVNATPNRAGILVIGPPDVASPNAMNDRTKGFRLFREDAAGKQRIKLNVGTGDGEGWFDGGAAADIDPTTNEWVFIAFTISSTQCVVYIDGTIVSQGSFSGVSWTGCDILSIASGAPRFVGWDHLSDNSLIDELRLFNKALTQEEVQDMMN